MSVGVRISIGAISGLAWAASLRAYMAEINWSATHVDWAGTFIGILLPGAAAGAALGAATILDARTPRGRFGLRSCAAAVLLFAVFPLLLPGQLWTLITTGMGGGAVGVALGGLAGGYALGGRTRWLRIVCAAPATVVVVGVAATVPLIGGSRLGATTPRGAWVMLLVATLLIVLMGAAAIPFRRLGAARSPDADADAATPPAEVAGSGPYVAQPSATIPPARV